VYLVQINKYEYIKDVFTFDIGLVSFDFFVCYLGDNKKLSFQVLQCGE